MFGEVLGSTVGAVFGGMSTLAYPDNIGLLRVTKVGSRYVTFATGVILLVLGGLGPFDRLLQAVPLPVLAAAGTILGQPLIIGTVLLVVLKLAFGLTRAGREARDPAPPR